MSIPRCAQYFLADVVCTGPLSLDQGTVHPSECSTEAQLPYNTRCTFACNDGYTLSGPASRVCTAEGVWNDERPVSCTGRTPAVYPLGSDPEVALAVLRGKPCGFVRLGFMNRSLNNCIIPQLQVKLTRTRGRRFMILRSRGTIGLHWTMLGSW